MGGGITDLVTHTGAPSLWRGRALALSGIVLIAFSLRSAVASLSPVVDSIGADFTLPPAVIGLIGTAPPVCFAIFGILTPMLEQRWGLERVAVIAMSAITIGLLSRGLVGESLGLLLTTTIIFAGVGMGNILLPPLVKKYFADRIGAMMTLYTTAMAFSTFVPPLVAVPVAHAYGWRVSLGLWGVFALAALIPWMVLLLGRRSALRQAQGPSVAQGPGSAQGVGVEQGADSAHGAGGEPGTGTVSDDAAFAATGPIATSPANRSMVRRLLRIPMMWALAVTFATSSTMAYVSFAWFPQMVIDIAGVDAATAGFLLSLFAFFGLPASLLVPVLVVRLQATRPVFFFGIATGLVGLIGLIVFPDPAVLWLWTMLFGLVGVLFPLSLVLISIRSRTPESAVVLSSLVQSVGYTIAAVFPLIVGVLHAATGSWTIPLIIIAAMLVAVIPAGVIAGRRRTVEDEWERVHGPW